MAVTPNYKGMFLRGYGSQDHTKNNGSLIGNTATNHASGGIGAIQGDTIRNATGIVGVNTERVVNRTTGLFSGVVNSSAAKPKSPRMEYFASPVMWNFTWADLNFSRQIPTANEIRPVNMAVRYLIRSR